jgi:hypothetical protein
MRKLPLSDRFFWNKLVGQSTRVIKNQLQGGVRILYARGIASRRIVVESLFPMETILK